MTCNIEHALPDYASIFLSSPNIIEIPFIVRMHDSINKATAKCILILNGT